jgi:mannose-6-phosphate isomerase-like protein (cupin superfamily)
MKKLSLWCASALLVCSVSGAGPEGFQTWKSDRLKSYADSLHAKMDAQKVAVENLANYGNHKLIVAHREGSGRAEQHQTQSDIFIVQSGEATLVVGGTIPGVKTESPGELRGAAVSGGVRQKIGPGDVVHIPPKTPHQLLVDAGKQVTYVTVKVDL